MTRIFAVGTLVLIGISVTSWAQQAPAQGQGGAPPATAAPSPTSVEQIEKEISSLPVHGFTYTAGKRRDPFVTLVTRGPETTSTTAAGRAAGLAGLNTSEVALRGILASEGSYVAMLLGSDDKTYIVRAGDKLADGTIGAIYADSLVIDQLVKDPLAQQKRREVRKALRQLEGTN
jgi:Tfp pilus assembly protein PilP